MALPPQVVEEFLKWAEEDVEAEKQKLSGSVDLLKSELKVTEVKLERLLEGYLDRVVDSGEYQMKKNKLIEEKLRLQ